MARLLGHRQTKEAATDKPNLRLPRHISTLPAQPDAASVRSSSKGQTSRKLLVR